MPLPASITIEPPSVPVRSVITVPGSKSITNRALVLAALAHGETELRGALWSEDTQVMVECLRELGFMVNIAPDPAEAGNRTVTVYGQGGHVPHGGSGDQPLELFVGNAGTAARFLASMVCLGGGTYRLTGVPRMHERPQAALFVALRELGYRVDSPNHKLPAVIHGSGPRSGSCQVNISESSQFASALLLSAKVGGWQVRISGENAEESPYVALTTQLIAAFPPHGGRFAIEPDCSSGSYFWAAGEFQPTSPPAEPPRDPLRHPGQRPEVFSVTVARWPQSGWQMDEAFPGRWLEICLGQRFSRAPGSPPSVLRPTDAHLADRGSPAVSRLAISRRDDLGDSIMTAMVLSPLLREPITYTELGRLRVQECERVFAVRTELARCGARVEEAGDTLTVWPSQLTAARIETYGDHRMAMCFAILGLKVPGIRIQNPACVKKTFPNFFQKLAARPPDGLGAVITDAESRRELRLEELFAD